MATLRGDAAARERALSALIQAAPADPEPYRILAAASSAAHQYGRAAGQLRQAAERMPANAALLNQLGYVEAFAGNLPGAVAALREYERLRPGEANPLDSLGDVNAAHGRFAEAVRFYLDAYGRDPNFLDGGTLFKAAQARLMAGDRGGADGLFGRYLEARRAAGDPVVEYRRAEWEWQSGRGRDALERLQRFAANFQDPAGRAWGDVAVWQLLSGNREAARAAALRTQLPLVRFWVDAGNSGDPGWSPRQRELAVACKFLLQSDFASAVAPLERLYAGWEPGADPAIPVLLAWAYQETGHPERAAPLVEFYPIPRNAGLSPAAALWFPRYFYVRGAVLASRGKAAEAQRAWRTFLDLSGPDDDIWRLRSRAREALASR